MAIFSCQACGLSVGTLGPANSASLFDPRCTACGGELESIDDEASASSVPAQDHRAAAEQGMRAP